MINKLHLELALCRKNTFKGAYKLLNISQILTQETLDKYTSSQCKVNSFIYKLTNVSQERKGLLQLVEAKILSMLEKNPWLFSSKDTYTIFPSYLYFSFTDEEDRTVFSAPHITSSILFNPNEETSTYTLCDDFNTARKSVTNYTKTYKRVDSNLVKLNHRLSIHGSNSAKPMDEVYQLDKQAIVNSLFNYYETKYVINVSPINYRSFYEDLPTVIPEILTISTYELRRFVYLSEKK